jgi:hypothetical protein
MPDILERVLLLAIYKKEDDESLGDVLKKLVHSGAFLNIKEAKNSLKILREKKYIVDNSLSMVGVLEAKKIEESFKLK